MAESLFLKYPYPFVSMKDEEHFTLWLQSIPCVKNIQLAGNHQGMDLTIDNLDIRSFHELFGLITRYGLDQSSLAKLCNAENESWMKDPKKGWYREVFGTESLAKPPPELGDPGVTAAAKSIHKAGKHYHWFSGEQEYEDMDIIGRSEFDGIIEQALLAADAARAAFNATKLQ